MPKKISTPKPSSSQKAKKATSKFTASAGKSHVGMPFKQKLAQKKQTISMMKQAVNAVATQHGLPKVTTAKIKRSLNFSHKAFPKGGNVEHGTGLRYHQFSNLTLSNAQHAQSYITDTGLSPMQTTQDWGTPRSNPSQAPKTQMHRSRRGSIVGLAPMPDGSVKAWRLHSLPTSEAIGDSTSTDSGNFAKAFDTHASRMSNPATNSVGKKQPVNSILSDVGKVRFNAQSQKFDFTEVTHAMGVSGSGVDTKHSTPSTQLFKPSIDVAKALGKAGRPEQTYHSEPMAITLHNGSRSTSMEHDSSLVGTFASFPNQVCRQCGDMFQQKVGSHAAITGVPGRPFGGQKPGDMFDKGTGSTVTRAAPMTDLVGNKKNQTEVKNIFDYHHQLK